MVTITEGLAELKTIQKRLEKKREYVRQFLGRQDGIRDPLEKDGGAVSVIARERQAIADLESRVVLIRTRIQQANHATAVTIEGQTRTIAEWLTWRKEVAVGSQQFINSLRTNVQQMRGQALSKGFAVVTPGGAATAPTDYIVNVDEAALAKEAEQIEIILGTLDGQLSLKNATTTIDV